MKTVNFHCLIKMFITGLAIASPLMSHSQNTQVLGTLPRAFESVTTSSLGIGFKGALDTYLSNAAYSGTSVQYSQYQTIARYEKKRFSFFDTRTSVSFSPMTNSRGNGSMIAVEVNEIATWGHPLLRNEKFDIMVGPSAVTSMGMLFNQRNSNNPAQFKFLLSAGASGKAIYRFNLLKRYMSLSADLTLPLLGLTFAPNYDEPYYFLATYEGLGSAFRVASPFNAPSALSDITLTLPAGRNNRLSLTYEANYTGYNILGHRSAIANHVFLAGFTSRFELKKD